MTGDYMGELLSDVSDDPNMIILLSDLARHVRSSLGDSSECWRGAEEIVELVAYSFADHFGHDLLFHKRQPPKPETVKSFAYVIATITAAVKDGPPS